jgi:hypothetical protein
VVFADLITAPLIVGLHRLSRDYIDELPPKAIACLFVDLPKRCARSQRQPGVRYKATGRETRENFKKPFQRARGTTSYSVHRDARTTSQIVVIFNLF